MELAEMQRRNVESPLRYLKAQEIKLHVRQEGPNLWTVPSQSKAGVEYIVRTGSNDTICSCPDYVNRPAYKCKHILAVELYARVQLKQAPTRDIRPIFLGCDSLDEIKELSDEEAKWLLREGVDETPNLNLLASFHERKAKETEDPGAKKRLREMAEAERAYVELV